MGLKPRRLILTGHTVSSKLLGRFLISNSLYLKIFDPIQSRYKSKFRMALFKSGTLQKPLTNIENIRIGMMLEMVLGI